MGFERYYHAAMRQQGMEVPSESTTEPVVPSDDMLLVQEGQLDPATQPLPVVQEPYEALVDPSQYRRPAQMLRLATAAGEITLGRYSRTHSAQGRALDLPSPAVTLAPASPDAHPNRGVIVDEAPPVTPVLTGIRTIPPRSSQDHPVDVVAMFRAAAEKQSNTMLARHMPAVKNLLHNGHVDTAVALVQDWRDFDDETRRIAGQTERLRDQPYTANQDMIARFRFAVHEETERMKAQAVKQTETVPPSVAQAVAHLEDAISPLSEAFDRHSLRPREIDIKELRKLRPRLDAIGQMAADREAARKARMAAEIAAANQRRATNTPLEPMRITYPAEPSSRPVTKTNMQPERTDPRPSGPKRFTQKFRALFTHRSRRKREQAEAQAFIEELRQPVDEPSTPQSSHVPLPSAERTTQPRVADLVRAARQRDGVYALQIVSEDQALARQRKVSS